MARQTVGAEEEFSAYFRTHYNAVLRYVERRVGAQEDAAELVGDVFRVAWLRFDAAASGSRAWLYQVARNVVLDHYRRTGRQRALLARVGDELALRGNSPADENPVLAALAELDEPARELLRLRYWEELSIAEIAVVLGISAPTARVRLHRARRQLEPLLTGTTRRSLS